jgi:hypothetical protein
LQLRLIGDAYFSVPVGEYILNEFAMFSLGVPLSKNYFTGVTAIAFERIRRMCCTQPGYADLPAADRQRIFMERSFDTFCLIACKLKSCKTGHEQLNLGLGRVDESFWREKFDTVFQYQGSIL